MNITIEVPDDIAHRLHAIRGDLSRLVLEALAIEAYRSGVITESKVQRMLNLPSRWEGDAFLKRAKLCLDYTEPDLDRDILAIRNLRLQDRFRSRSSNNFHDEFRSMP